jgi:hypothetical protein
MTEEPGSVRYAGPHHANRAVGKRSPEHFFDNSEYLSKYTSRAGHPTLYAAQSASDISQCQVLFAKFSMGRPMGGREFRLSNFNELVHHPMNPTFLSVRGSNRTWNAAVGFISIDGN